MPPALNISGLHKKFKEQQALDGLSFIANSGEWLGILGPNGAGKTTLVRAISGRVSLDAGEIKIGEVVVSGANRKNGVRRKLGIVPQDISLYSRLSGAENLKFWGELSGIHWRILRSRIEWALEWTGLSDRKNDLVKNYSGGMARRLNIACSILHEPEYVLLDEPTVGVDPQSRERIWEMLKQLHTKGTTILLTTHQMDEAQKVCDRLVIMDNGKNIAEGTFSQLLEQTVGSERVVHLKVTGNISDALSCQQNDTGFERLDEDTLSYRMAANDHDDISTVIQKLIQMNLRVKQLVVLHPTLQDVFLHLTGKELRQ